MVKLLGDHLVRPFHLSALIVFDCVQVNDLKRYDVLNLVFHSFVFRHAENWVGYKHHEIHVNGTRENAKCDMFRMWILVFDRPLDSCIVSLIAMKFGA